MIPSLPLALSMKKVVSPSRNLLECISILFFSEANDEKTSSLPLIDLMYVFFNFFFFFSSNAVLGNPNYDDENLQLVYDM